MGGGTVTAAQITRRALSAAVGWAAGDAATAYTHLVPGYGRSMPGDDPLALLVAVVVAALCWRVVARIERGGR